MSPSIINKVFFSDFSTSHHSHRLVKREEFEVSLGDRDYDTVATTTEGPNGNDPTVIVKAEEVFIVVILLLLWIGAIALFFNRWGKIRMLEPYQPKFCEAHRASCPIAAEVVPPMTHFQRSISKYNLSTGGDIPPHFAKCTFHGLAPPSHSLHGGSGTNFLTTSALISTSGSRPRVNSVFVTSAHSHSNSNNSGKALRIEENTRKAKSAIDLSTIVLSDEFFEREKPTLQRNIVTARSEYSTHWNGARFFLQPNLARSDDVVVPSSSWGRTEEIVLFDHLLITRLLRYTNCKEFVIPGLPPGKDLSEIFLL